MARQGPSTLARYDELDAEAALIATDLETRASKLTRYVSEWEQMTTDQQNRALILAIADRLGIEASGK
ncbi:hypothetical protein [Bradyrhizobium sp. WSM1417]|uniref:hypothetical protein n=1 Tax=Bradyrhizobium sp. WSM1417 TaxID=754500 RepID=UPI0012EBFDD9|nr:hypothetical protein [Bradyrhizobium sp. WSM1417]